MAVRPDGQLRTLASESSAETEPGVEANSYRDAFEWPSLQDGRVLGIEDLGALPRHSAIQRALLARGVRSYVVVPMCIQGELVGLLYLEASRPRAFTSDHIEVAIEVAVLLAVAIRQARLYDQAQQEIAERKRAEEDMRQAKDVAEEATRAKSAFVSMVSHELRTPLTSVLGFARMAREQLEEIIFPALGSDDVKVQRAVQRVSSDMAIIESEGKRMGTLVNDVLDLAKIESGRMDWNAQRCSALDIVESALAATSSLFSGRPVQLLSDVKDDLPAIYGDRDRLIQVIVNLISNAAKYTAEGSVTCRARGHAAQPGCEDGILISVIDTGTGIDPADHERVFEQFVQVGEAVSHGLRGTGLGLSICKNIVEHHGGYIWVESELGHGAAFHFVLPQGESR
jgi:signal transduction histidine kinase